MNPLEQELAEILMVSQVTFVQVAEGEGWTELANGMKAKIERTTGSQCERCWVFSHSQQAVCVRCASVLGAA